MSVPQDPFPGKLIISVLSAQWEELGSELRTTLQNKFGSTDYQSEKIPFTETRYYNAELGTPIHRRIFAFAALRPQDCLPDIKLECNDLESRYMQGKRRIFNLDPGILSHERLVLATGKNFTHRIYLGRGIWADLTLIYTHGDWQDLPWTFPDYAAEKTKKHLREVRTIYCTQIKNKS